VTGESFEGFMQATVLGPLGMPHSTFDWRRAERSSLATTYDVHGRPTPLRRFTALAAASLYTSASDLVPFVQAHLPGPHGEPVGRGVLEPATVLRMRSPQAAILGRDIWGLGTILYARNGHGGYVIGHDGQSPPAINTAARLDPATGDGIIVLASGSPTLATELASEWVLWQTGNVDVFMLRASADALAWMVVAGTIPIGLGALLLATRPRTGSDAPAGPSPGPDP
jgi:CubicO group peptidase (beta-lactamase class C family)